MGSLKNLLSSLWSQYASTLLGFSFSFALSSAALSASRTPWMTPSNSASIPSSSSCGGEEDECVDKPTKQNNFHDFETTVQQHPKQLVAKKLKVGRCVLLGLVKLPNHLPASIRTDGRHFMLLPIYQLCLHLGTHGSRLYTTRGHY